MAREHWDDPEHRGPDEDARARRRRRRHRHRSRRSLTPQEREMRAAQRRVNAWIGFATHFTAYASVCIFLLAFRGFRAAMAVAFGWSIGIAFHYFAAIAAPRMRRRLLAREVQRQVASGVPRERRTFSDKHVRSLEDLSAQVAHEIRNPITAAKSLVQQMGEDPASAENVAYAKIALEELDRVERSVAHLLRFAREEDLRLTEVRLASVIDSALESFRERIAAQRVRLVREVATDAVLRGDPEQLRRVLINLVNNALDALAEGPSADPTLEVLAGENLAATECWVRVRDNGPGIDAEALARIWSPFYTSKESGTGLGLAIAKKVVDAHGGSLEVTSRPGAGAEFTITIPKPAPAA
jgi:signal transduction histidine kinase